VHISDERGTAVTNELSSRKSQPRPLDLPGVLGRPVRTQTTLNPAIAHPIVRALADCVRAAALFPRARGA